MARTIKLSDDFIEIAAEESRLMRRSTGAQVEYWARLGRQIEASGAIGLAHIRRLLLGSGSVQELSAEDDEAYLTALTAKLEALDGSDTRVVDDLRAGGHPIVYENEQGELVAEKSIASAEGGK